MLVAAGLGRVKVESVAGEVEVAGRKINGFIADDLPETPIAAVQVERCVEVRQSPHRDNPFHHDATGLLPVEGVQPVLPEQPGIDLVLALFSGVCGEALHFEG